MLAREREMLLADDTEQAASAIGRATCSGESCQITESTMHVPLDERFDSTIVSETELLKNAKMQQQRTEIETELLERVGRSGRDRIVADAIAESNIAKISDVAGGSFETDNLQILATIVRIEEELRVGGEHVHNRLATIESGAEMHHRLTRMGGEERQEIASRLKRLRDERVPRGSLDRAIRERILPAGMDERDLGMLRHQTILASELVRVAPEIVAGAVSDKISTAARDSVEIIGLDTAILRIDMQRDDVRILIGISADNVSRAIGRSIVIDNNLVREIDLLSQDRIKSATDGVLLIKADHNDRYDRCYDNTLHTIKTRIRPGYCRLTRGNRHA